MVQSKCESCQVGRRKWGLSFYPVRLYSPRLTIFFLPLFQLSKQEAWGPAKWLFICPLHQQVSVPPLAQITSTTEQISLGSSVIYCQPPPSDHKIRFLDVERDLLSRAACPKKHGFPFFLPRSFASVEHCVAAVGALAVRHGAEPRDGAAEPRPCTSPPWNRSPCPGQPDMDQGTQVPPSAN